MTNLINGTNLNDTLVGTSGDDVIYGLDGTDVIDSGAGNDYINPGDNNRDYDWIYVGSGIKLIDLSDIVFGYVGLDYRKIPNSITVNIDGYKNTAYSDKGVSGEDTIIEVNNALGGYGVAVVGTEFSDVFNIAVDFGQFIQVRSTDGTDVYNFSGEGRIVFDLRSASGPTSIDLGVNLIENDGFGNEEYINGSVVRVRATSFDDFVSSVGLSQEVWIEGYEGNDTLISGDMSDRLVGGDGDDVIIGGAGDDDIEGGLGNDDLTGGAGADRFIFQFALSDYLGRNVIRDFNPYEGDSLELWDESGEEYEDGVLELNVILTSDPSGNALLSTFFGEFTFVGWTAAEFGDYADVNPEPVIADPSADIFIVQRGIIGKGSGYDEYILSKWTVDAEAEITITDSGDNALQFINGFEVSSSMVAANAMLLTLSNGAVVTVLDASSYDYTVGGNPLENEAGLSFTYQTFVEDVLGVEMPTGSQISHGDAVTITSDMTFGNDVIVTSGSAVSGTDAADEFQLDVSNGGVFEIISFDITEDSLALSGIASADNDILSDLVGDVGVGGQAVTVQYDPFAQETFINLGLDADGEVVALTLVGITQDDWSSVALV